MRRIASIVHVAACVLGTAALAVAQLAPAANSAALPSAAPDPKVTLPITMSGRFDWMLYSTVGPSRLAGGAVSAAWGTWVNTPSEYGPHWKGFAERNGLRLTGVALSNAMEAGLGALWNEDPRYVAAAGQPFRNRLVHIFKMTFYARNQVGAVKPAYARYVAIGASNFVSDAWRPDSTSTVGPSCVRIGLGFLGRMGANAFDEFWPDISRRLFHKNISLGP